MARAVRKKELTAEERLAAALVPEEEQPYKVPGNWCWVRVGAICSFIGGGTPSKRNDKYWNGNVPWASVKDIKGDYLYETVDHITEAGLLNSSSNMCEEDDLLLVTRIEPAKTIISKIKTAINQDLKIVKSNLSPIFLHYYFKNFKHDFEMKSSGSTVQGITLSNVQNNPLPLPPMNEQQRIVTLIESLFADLDEAKEKLTAVVEGFAQRKAAILHQAFTGELTAKWREEHGIELDAWKEITFADGCDKITDGTHHSPENNSEGEFMYVTAKNIKETGIDLSNITYVTKSVHDEIYSRCDVCYGDVLYIKDGATTGIATVNTLNEPFSLLSSVAVLRPKHEVLLSGYMKYYLNAPSVKAKMLNQMSGNAITRLTLKKIKSSTILLCGIQEQREIVRILDDLFEQEQQAQSAVENVLADIDTLKKSILARAFRGELATNDPGEENAVEMLKKML